MSGCSSALREHARSAYPRVGSVRRSFFMREPETVQQAAYRGTVHLDPMHAFQRGSKLVQCRCGMGFHLLAYPTDHSGQLAMTTAALSPRLKVTGFPLQLDHVVHELHRHTEMRG